MYAHQGAATCLHFTFDLRLDLEVALVGHLWACLKTMLIDFLFFFKVRTLQGSQDSQHQHSRHLWMFRDREGGRSRSCCQIDCCLGVASPGFRCCPYSFLGLGAQGVGEGMSGGGGEGWGGAGLCTDHPAHRPRSVFFMPHFLHLVIETAVPLCV